MYQTHKGTGKYLQIDDDTNFGFYGSEYTKVLAEGAGYNKLAMLGSTPHVEPPSCGFFIGHSFSSLQLMEKHPSFIIRQKDREIAYLKETIIDMKRRLSMLERSREGPSIYMRAITIQEKPIEEILKSVLNYYNTHSVAYPDEVADALGLDLRKVIEVVDRLIAEGKIEVAT